MSKMTEVEDFVLKREAVGFSEDDWLRKHGWKMTCELPGCFWLWHKTINGFRVCVNRAMALRIEINI